MKNKSLKKKIRILTNIDGLKNKKKQQNMWKNEGNEGKKTNMEILMVKKLMAGKEDVLVERMILILEKKVWSPREGGEGGD